MVNYSLQELQILIINWADEKNLIKPENAPKQRLKLIEESGELASAILKSNIEEQKDAIGDIYVVLIILAEQTSYKLRLTELLKWYDDNYSNDPSILIKEIIQYAALGSIQAAITTLWHLSVTLNYNLEECSNLAYQTIKNRTGKTISGTFIKD